MFGKMLMYISMSALLISSVMYFLSDKKNVGLLKYARWLFYASAISIVGASFYLMANILAHNFQLTYIWENSSKNLEPYLLFSSFYAGQQGSFLLWLLFFSVLGLFLIPYSRKHGYESLNMGFFTMIMFLVVLMLVFKSPFDYLWETFSDNSIKYGFMPQNGRGLNPVLENYWMAIHPPVLFAGYAVLSVPFVFALTAALRKDFVNWVNYAIPWALLGASILGLGIMLGGFWAYETLGWGGFWGWDPVENSSLLPWIAILTFIHSAAIQRATKSLIKTNFVLALFSFILVLYATFLTRSGILGDSSVHSFTDPGKAVYFLLIAIVLINLILGLYTLLLRKNKITVTKLNGNLSARESWLFLGSVILLLSIVIIFLGTNWSVITDFFGMKKSKVEISFYTNWSIPLAILIFLTNGFSLFLSWKDSTIKAVIRKTLPAILVSAILTIIFIFAGLKEIGIILLVLTAFFSIMINIQFVFIYLKKTPFKLGGLLAHAGFSVLIIGIIISNFFSTSQNVNFSKNTPVKINNYNFKVVDKVEVERSKTDRQKFIYRIEATKDNQKFEINPVVYWSEFNGMQSPIIEPGIKNTFMQDIYLVLRSADVRNPMNTLTIEKGQKTALMFDSSAIFEFVNYDMGHSLGRKNLTLGVLVKLSRKDTVYFDTLFISMENKSVFKNLQWKHLKSTNYDISFIRFIPQSDNIAQSQIVLAFKPTGTEFIEPTEVLICNVSFKPLMSLVWIGVIMTTFGFILSIFNHKEKKV